VRGRVLGHSSREQSENRSRKHREREKGEIERRKKRKVVSAWRKKGRGNFPTSSKLFKPLNNQGKLFFKALYTNISLKKWNDKRFL
jgi:hypothetical protein